MPKKKPGMTPEEQSEKFREAVREMIAAGDLNPTEADQRFKALLERAKAK
jgi:polyhydroxyalkanoate synthesis regulator phasin